MNIALVTETYPPEINGVAMTLSQLVNALRNKGHAVQVVRPTRTGDTHDNDHELTVHGLPIPRYSLMSFGLPSISRLLRSWKRTRPDVVHVATEGPLGLSAIRAAKRLGIPCTSTFHTNFHSYSDYYDAAWMKGLVLAYLRWIHNQTRCNLFPTKELSEELETYGFKNNAVLGRGVKLDLFNPARRDAELRSSWGASEADRVIIHVSRLSAEKNYDLLHEAYQRILIQAPRTKLVIVGEGPEEAYLKQLFPEAVFTGPIPLEDRSELGRYYASADLFLYPSETETFGNVITEALASGLGCVAYDYAAAHIHIEHGVNGLLAPIGNRKAFIEACSLLATDHALFDTVRSNTQKNLQRLDWAPVLESFESALSRATA